VPSGIVGASAVVLRPVVKIADAITIAAESISDILLLTDNIFFIFFTPKKFNYALEQLLNNFRIKPPFKLMQQTVYVLKIIPQLLSAGQNSCLSAEYQGLI
jgi:hypothetical protein